MKGLSNLLLFILFIIIVLQGCTTESMRRAEEIAATNPTACEQSLAEGAPANNSIKVGDEAKEYFEKHDLYMACLTKEVKANPDICIDVLANDTLPVVTGWGPTKQQAQQIAEVIICRIHAKSKLENKNVYTSRLNLDQGIYEGDASSSNVVIGRIQSAQVENLSTQGSVGGSQLGAGVGQVVYLENNKDLSGYNPWSQLGAGLAGAMIGSSLDNPGKVKYKKTYWVKTNRGTFVSFGHMDVRPDLLPETMCVAIVGKSRIKQAKENLCKS